IKSRSLPVLGAWIEILTSFISDTPRGSRSLYWERGLKFSHVSVATFNVSRSLYWERGLKLLNLLVNWKKILSLPVLGAWIEILNGNKTSLRDNVAPCIGSVD